MSPKFGAIYAFILAVLVCAVLQEFYITTFWAVPVVIWLTIGIYELAFTKR